MHVVEGGFCKTANSGILTKSLKEKKQERAETETGRWVCGGSPRSNFNWAGSVGCNWQKEMAVRLGEAGPGAVNAPGSFDAGKQGIELVLDRRQRRCRGQQRRRGT